MGETNGRGNFIIPPASYAGQGGIDRGVFLIYTAPMRLPFTKPQVKEVKKQSKEAAMPRDTHPDAIYRRLRMLEARIRADEEAVSTLRRDVNRIDRKQYREASGETLPQTAPDHAPTPFDIIFRGGF